MTFSEFAVTAHIHTCARARTHAHINFPFHAAVITYSLNRQLSLFPQARKKQQQTCQPFCATLLLPLWVCVCVCVGVTVRVFPKKHRVFLTVFILCLAEGEVRKQSGEKAIANTEGHCGATWSKKNLKTIKHQQRPVKPELHNSSSTYVCRLKPSW